MIIRAVRKSSHVRQDDMAAMVGVSRQFAVDVEKGKSTIQLGRVLRLLKELGIELSVDIPESAHLELERLRLRRQVAPKVVQAENPIVGAQPAQSEVLNVNPQHTPASSSGIAGADEGPAT